MYTNPHEQTAGTYHENDGAKEKKTPLGERIRILGARYATEKNLSLLGLCAAMLCAGTVIGIVTCKILGERLDTERFRAAWTQRFAFRGYENGVAYFREYVKWFAFYEKRLLVPLLFAATYYAGYFCCGYLIYEGFLLGYTAVTVTAEQFSFPYLLFLFGCTAFAFLPVLFSVKAIRYAGDTRRALTEKKEGFCFHRAVSLLIPFGIYSTLIAAGLLLSSAVSDLML